MQLCAAVYNGLWSENPLARKSPLLPNDTITHHLPRSFLYFILFYNKPYTTLVSGHNDTSGKSTLAASLNGQTFAADDYFNRDGKEKMEKKKYFMFFLPSIFYISKAIIVHVMLACRSSAYNWYSCAFRPNVAPFCVYSLAFAGTYVFDPSELSTAHEVRFL